MGGGYNAAKKIRDIAQILFHNFWKRQGGDLLMLVSSKFSLNDL